MTGANRGFVWRHSAGSAAGPLVWRHSAGSAAGPLVQSLFLVPQPPAGVGMQCAATGQFSYAQVEVSKSELKLDLLDDSDQPVLNTGDVEASPAASPCSQVVIPAVR